MIGSIGNNVNSYSLTRVSGMASGLDTETIVKQLTALEQNKINAAQQQKQLLIWKRDSYREIIDKLSDFKNKYFGTSDNILSGGIFSQIKSTNSAPQYVTITPGATASKSNIIISDIVSLASASKVESSSPVSQPPAISVDLSKTSGLSGKTIKFTLDGNAKILTFSTGDYSTVDAVRNELQSMVNYAFGGNRIMISIDGNDLKLDSGSSTMILGRSGIQGFEAADILGFDDGGSNRINLNDTLANINLAQPVNSPVTFKINGTSFSFAGSSTMRDVMNAVNSSSAGVAISYSGVTDSFTVTSSQTGAGTNITLEDVTGTFINSIIGAGQYTNGTNAEIKINTNASTVDPGANTYTTVIRSSNIFELDGNTYSLSGKASGIAEENIIIGLSADIDGMTAKIKDFVAAYNDMLNTITSKLSEKPDKDYPPLTDEQKKSMNQTDIDNWTKKAKTGLLSNDILLNSIAAAFRNSLYNDVKRLDDNNQGIGLALTDIGISTKLYSDKGKLNIDEDKLRKALTDKQEEVAKLLAQKSSINYSQYLTENQKATRYKESGLFSRINDIIESSISRTGTKGSLIQLAGSSNDAYETKNIYNDKIKNMDITINKLIDKLNKDQDRYWARFTSMESALSKLNSQSNWLAQQLGSLNNGG